MTSGRRFTVAPFRVGPRFVVTGVDPATGAAVRLSDALPRAQAWGLASTLRTRGWPADVRAIALGPRDLGDAVLFGGALGLVVPVFGAVIGALGWLYLRNRATRPELLASLPKLAEAPPAPAAVPALVGAGALLLVAGLAAWVSPWTGALLGLAGLLWLVQGTPDVTAPPSFTEAGVRAQLTRLRARIEGHAARFEAELLLLGELGSVEARWRRGELAVEDVGVALARIEARLAAEPVSRALAALRVPGEVR